MRDRNLELIISLLNRRAAFSQCFLGVYRVERSLTSIMLDLEYNTNNGDEQCIPTQLNTKFDVSYARQHTISKVAIKMRWNAMFITAVCVSLRIHSFEVIWNWISDPRSLRGSWFFKGTNVYMTRENLLVPLMHHDLSDLGSLIRIQISPKERTLNQATTTKKQDFI